MADIALHPSGGGGRSIRSFLNQIVPAAETIPLEHISHQTSSGTNVIANAFPFAQERDEFEGVSRHNPPI
jgi:hypothetical protein